MWLGEGGSDREPVLGKPGGGAERMSNLLAGLSNRKDEVKRRCRTVLQSRAEELLRNPQSDSPPIHKCTSHLGFSLGRLPPLAGGGTADSPAQVGL